MESSKRIELSLVKKHEHACAERLVQTRELLHEVIALVKHPVPPGAPGANDVCSNAVKISSFS